MPSGFDPTIALEWMLALVYLVAGSNDLFLDLVFYFKPLRRALAQGRANPRCEEWELHAPLEKSVAILIPAWDEASVIGAMLESTSDRLDYTNYDIFVGCYPNDEATQFEVARAAFDRPRIHRVVCPNPGPTSKADCLNWVVEAIKLKETETGKRYEIFVLQDAEDVVHPLSLKVFNRFVPEYDMVQLPVIPYERALTQVTGNTYLDEFAENHLKTLTSRLAVGGMIPSAGVGTAFSRAACDELAEQTNHVLFPPVSLTEDYDFSFRLFRNQRKSGIAEVWVDRTDASGRHVKELVAIREFFPANFGDAVRQKQRWLLGITFQGAQKLGWGTGWRERYMLLRDRIGVVTALFNLLALFIFFRIGELILEAQLEHRAWQSTLPAYHAGSALAIVIDINLLLLANRLFQRAYFVSRVGRKRQVFAAPFRMLWSNIVDFACAYHAIRRFTQSSYTGKPLKWLKTAHEYPDVETLLRRHRPLGDILLERRIITPDQLREGLALQSTPAFRSRYLGEILSELLAISQDQLLEALAVQTDTKAALRTSAALGADVEGDAIPLNINQVVPPTAGQEAVPSLFPSQLTPAPAPSKGASYAGVPVGLASDPIARVSRGVPHRSLTRSFVFSGAAARPRASRPLSVVSSASGPLSPGAEAKPTVYALTSNPAPISTEAPTAITRLVPNVPAPPRRFAMLHAASFSFIRPCDPVRFLVVIGTRPEAIKLAPVITELRARSIRASRPNDVFVCITGQHGDMVVEPLALFGIKPDHDLNLMQPGQSLAALGARVLESFAEVLISLKPEWVLVQGDTATTAMAATAAFYAGVKVAHVEAGLRTQDLQNPFPEEANRRMVSIVTTVHFAATDAARKNLLREGVIESAIKVTGNTGIDALRYHCERLGISLAPASLQSAASASSLESQVITANPVRILVTAHRRENLESGIFDICHAIRALVDANPNRFHFVWPLHPNPRVADLARRYLAGLRDVTLTAAVRYDRLLALLSQCDIVLTDSGGLQEEAPSFGKTVLIMREATERPEGIWAGVARLVGTDPGDIQRAVEETALRVEAEQTEAVFKAAAKQPVNPYGDGRAASRIADFFSNLPVHEFVCANATVPATMPAQSNSLQRAAVQIVQ